MHFVREIYVGDTVRVFDSDFVVRDVNGQSTLFEVFGDEHVAVQMAVTPLQGAGLCIRGERITYRGFGIPSFGLRVEFHSRVERNAGGLQQLHIDGHLLWQPDSKLGRFVAFGVLRSPEELGRIRYRIRDGETATSGSGSASSGSSNVR